MHIYYLVQISSGLRHDTDRDIKLLFLVSPGNLKPGGLYLRGYSYTPKSDTISRFYTHFELDMSKRRAKFQLVPQEMINL